MLEKLYHLYVDSQERSLLLHSLVELKNQLINRADIRIVLTSLFLRS